MNTVSLDEPVENSEGFPEPREFADWSENPEAVLLDAELWHAMDAAIASLSETLCSVFVLRDVNGLSTMQTAEVLGLSEEAVKSRLLRARLALREKLAGCRNCRVVVDTLRKTVTLYQTCGEDQVPDDVQERLFKVLDLEQLRNPSE